MSERFVCILLAFAFCLTLSACERKANAPTQDGAVKRYELKGKVVSIDRENKRLNIAHEEIKDFMAAMTMPFSVKDDTHFSQVAVGDELTATLLYNSNDNLYWLENLKVVRPAK